MLRVAAPSIAFYIGFLVGSYRSSLSTEDLATNSPSIFENTLSIESTTGNECPESDQPNSSGNSSEPLGRVSVRKFKVTAYCPGPCCCQHWSDGITASGKPVTYNNGRFAAGPQDLPFGTIVDIPGYGKVEVIDRGGTIKGDRLDVFFPDDPGKPGSGHQKALEWGVQQLDVRIREAVD